MPRLCRLKPQLLLSIVALVETMSDQLFAKQLRWMSVQPACKVRAIHPCRRPRRLGGGKGGEGREPREPKDPNKRMKAGLPPNALPGALGDR